MLRRSFVLAMAALITFVCWRAVSWKEIAKADGGGAPLNVLFITVDTLRADHVGAYGYSAPTTPHLDELASNGIRFAHAFSTSSWTLPAHASLLTGLYPAEHGVRTESSALPESATTLAEVLSQNGYRTFAAVSHPFLAYRWGLDQGIRDFDGSAANDAPVNRPIAAHIVDAALRWIDDTWTKSAPAEKRQPYFVWLHIFDPHWEYVPPAPYDRMFDPAYQGRMDGSFRSLKPYIKYSRKEGEPPPPPLSAEDLKHVRALYDGEIRYVDEHLGRLLDGLQSRGLMDSTLVVLTSDHGEEFMEHGSLEGHQWTLYDEVISVPLILHASHGRCSKDAHPASAVIARQVSTVGVAGTVLDCLGIQHGMPSLYPLIAAESGSAPYHGISPIGDSLIDLTFAGTTRIVGLRTTDAKLLRWPDGHVELYENPSAGEHDDVAAAEPERVKQLSQRLDAALAQLQPVAGIGTPSKPLDLDTVQRLRATGYVE